MESEHQPWVICYCRFECEAKLWDCKDWETSKWIGGDPDCLHECEDPIDMLARYKW